MGWVQIVIFCAVLLAIVPLLGGYMARVFTYEARRPQSWKDTRCSVITFSLLSWLLLFLILRTQTLHPFNPNGFHSGTWDLVVQHGVVVRHEHELAVLRRRDDALGFSQMAGLAVQNFVSAAVGICVRSC